MQRVISLLALIILILNSNVVWAQKEIPLDKNNVVKNKADRKQVIDFEDELVEGSAQKPELFYLFQKKNFNYKRLIKLRENFLPEMRKTSEDIQRLKGGH